MGNECKFGHIIFIVIDIINLAEQFGIYFIAKQNDLDEISQQRFFFILFGIGGASLFKPLFAHPVLFLLFSIGIETGELVSYLLLLSRTTSLLVVSILFYCLEILLHLVSAPSLFENDTSRGQEFASACGRLPVKIILYGLVFETQLFFLFLDPESSFRSTYYEILMILATFLGLSSVEKASKKCCSIEDQKGERNSLEEGWERILSLVNALLAPIITITAVVYASEALKNKDQLKTYDFAIYILIIISYGSVLLSVAMALLCSLCLCAASFLKAITDCICGK